MKRLSSLIVILFSLTLFPCTVSYAEVNPQRIIAGAAVPETVLVDRDGVKIIAKGLYTGLGPKITLTFNVQNTRDENLIIFPNDCTVNSFQLFAIGAFLVPKQSNADYELYLDDNTLELSQIEHIMIVGLTFDVNTEDYDTIFETEEVTYVTSDYGLYEQQYYFPGTTIYDENNLKITVLPQIIEDSIGRYITLYIENNADYCVDISDRNYIVVNGKILNSDLFASVYAGKRSMETFFLSWETLAKNEITSINSVGISLSVNSSDFIFMERYKTSDIGYMENVSVEF